MRRIQALSEPTGRFQTSVLKLCRAVCYTVHMNRISYCALTCAPLTVNPLSFVLRPKLARRGGSFPSRRPTVYPDHSALQTLLRLSPVPKATLNLELGTLNLRVDPQRQ